VSQTRFHFVAKELVFDIDMNAYDDIRSCCHGNTVCNKCWKYISLAMRVIHRALQDDFGFKDIKWIFSGRRGVHCWVSDETALFLDRERRQSIVSYLTPIEVQYSLII
jgi:DNA primase small subunit